MLQAGSVYAAYSAITAKSRGHLSLAHLAPRYCFPFTLSTQPSTPLPSGNHPFVLCNYEFALLIVFRVRLGVKLQGVGLSLTACPGVVPCRMFR